MESGFSQVKSFWNPSTLTPWLLLAESTHENPDGLRTVYNHSNNKCYRLKVPETFGNRCWGSSYGWIAMQTFDLPCITNLPSVLTLPHQPNDPLEPADPNLEPNDPVDDPPHNPGLEFNDHPHNPEIEPNNDPLHNPDLEPNDPLEPDNLELNYLVEPADPILEPDDLPHNPDLEPNDPPEFVDPDPEPNDPLEPVDPDSDPEPNDPPKPVDPDLEPNDPLEPSDSDLESDNLNPNEPLNQQQWYFTFFVARLVVLKMPLNWSLNDGGSGGDSNLLIAAIFAGESLAFARPGDQSWTYIVSEATDVACVEDRIYIVRCDGQLLYCDIKGCEDLKDVKVMAYAPSCRSQLDGYDKVFLLELCGDLVMVVRSKTSLYTGSPLTIGFDVYRLANKIKKWVEIKDIGKFSIFVGHHSSMACPISAPNNYISNSIYITDDQHSEWRDVPGFGGDDMGVYNIGSRTIKLFYFGDEINSPFCPPIFFLLDCSSTS